MLRSIHSHICVFLAAFFAIGLTVQAEDAASSYYLAILELDRRLPDYVDNATTDHPSQGFAVQMSEKQVSFLQEQAVVSALSRFDDATSCRNCEWQRYSSSSWRDAHLNDRLHALARIVLLRARHHYEHEEWSDGNRDVERVRILARHMTLQARPWEHQCFMIENMATGTSAAYILRLPVDALTDLAERHRRVGAFTPMSQMLTAEAVRVRSIANEYEVGRVAPERLLDHMDSCLADEEVKKILRMASRIDAASHLRKLSTFEDELSRFMNRCGPDTEHEINELFRRHAQGTIVLGGMGDWPVDEYRENAQGVCRGIMFGAVIDHYKDGRSDLANIADPYGNNALTFHETATGLTLVSELMNSGQIDFGFGLAGRGEETSKVVNPSSR